MSDRHSVLFVCLGNVCRSPLAEGAFRAAAQRAGLDVEVDSAGTADYHIGKPPNPRAIAEAQKHGIDISNLRARQLHTRDFARFTHIFAMDRQNLEDVKARNVTDGTARIGLLLDAVPGREGADVADPYYDGEEHLRDTWEDVAAAAEALVARFST